MGGTRTRIYLRRRFDRTFVDTGLLALSRSANKGRLWLGCAVVGACLGGQTRRAALRGASSLAATSLVVNTLLKPLISRNRPDIEVTPVIRRLARQPWTTSFPSAHAASASAFATGAALESPAAALVVGPLAAAVGYSRVHVGVHYPSDVLAGAAIGAAIASATLRWWPTRLTEPEWQPHSRPSPRLSEGEGLLVFANSRAGNGERLHERLKEHVPRADIVELADDVDIDAEVAARNTSVRALGVAGGDGTVASVVGTAIARGLPLAIFPAGTMNHFARDAGLVTFADTQRALNSGHAIAVDVATSGNVPFLNTSSIGAYPDIIQRRERLEPRLGKWVAMVVATARALREQEPIPIRIDGSDRLVWSIFVGNGHYHPKGPFPVWRPRVDDGVLDVRVLEAGILSRLRAVMFTLARPTAHFGASSGWTTTALTVSAPQRQRHVGIARDGERGEEAARFDFRKLPARLTVYHPGR